MSARKPSSPGGKGPKRRCVGHEERREQLEALYRRHTPLDDPEFGLFSAEFPCIMDEHYDPVWRVLERKGVREPLLAEQVQDVFEELVREVKDGRAPDDFRPWLCELASRRGWNQVRRARRDPVTVGAPSSRSEPAASSGDLARKLDRKLLRERFLPALPPAQRQAIEAITFGEMSHEEAAIALQVKRTTLTSRVQAAEERLREMMKSPDSGNEGSQP